MSRKLVLDSCVFLTYASYNKLYRLVNAIDTYNLEVKGITAKEILEPIYLFTIYTKTTQSFKNCPDPKDNFLFDIALQMGCEAIITIEKVLLNYVESPISVRDIVWFKQTFEVPV